MYLSISAMESSKLTKPIPENSSNLQRVSKFLTNFCIKPEGRKGNSFEEALDDQQPVESLESLLSTTTTSHMSFEILNGFVVLKRTDACIVVAFDKDHDGPNIVSDILEIPIINKEGNVVFVITRTNVEPKPQISDESCGVCYTESSDNRLAESQPVSPTKVDELFKGHGPLGRILKECYGRVADAKTEPDLEKLKRFIRQTKLSLVKNSIRVITEDQCILVRVKRRSDEHAFLMKLMFQNSNLLITKGTEYTDDVTQFLFPVNNNKLFESEQYIDGNTFLMERMI